jgi:hypothetical protein
MLEKKMVMAEIVRREDCQTLNKIEVRADVHSKNVDDDVNLY